MATTSKVCRVCLSSDVTMCKIADTPLQDVYEKLTNTQLLSADKPIEACYICYADLNKCRMVMVNAVKADKVLTALLEKNAKVKKKPVPLNTPQNNSPEPATSQAECDDTGRLNEVEIKQEESEESHIEIEFEVLEDARPEKRKAESERNTIEKQDLRTTGETNEKPIECHICRCTFKDVSNLKKHLPSHSGIKYECHICRRIFLSKGNFKVHLRTHRE